ncbi:MAG: GGDEF domain-containing protein [Colwellia sp.]
MKHLDAIKPEASQRNFNIELNGAAIDWDLNKGSFNFFGLDSVLFWTNPSLMRIFAPLAKEHGIDLFRLLVADSSSYGTDEDYQLMISTLGTTFEEGFLAWGLAVSSAGWGMFELPVCDYQLKKATVIVKHNWEMSMQAELPENERWGCPFLQGKIIGLFTQAFGSKCWADDKCNYNEDYVEFTIYTANKTIPEELACLRTARMAEKERELSIKVKHQTAQLEYAHKELENYSKTLEEKVEARTQKLELLLDLLEDEKNKLKVMADTDPMTGLLNRRAFYKKYNILRLQRENNTTTTTDSTDSLVAFDIDFFKKINDEYGHSVGDQVLIAFSNIFKENFYATDICARFGGEEFVLICTDVNLVTNPKPLKRFLQKIENHTIYVDGISIKFTVSAGATIIKNDDLGLDQTMKIADYLLYKAKGNGRNQVVVA